MKPLAAAIESLGIDSALARRRDRRHGRGRRCRTSTRCRTRSTTRRARRSSTSSSTCRSTAASDLRKVPLRARRALLAALLEQARRAIASASARRLPATPAQMLEAARRMQLEGIIVKRPDAPYVSQRSETWLKLKCAQRQEFVICGFTDRNGARGEVGSLFLGTYEARRAHLRRQRRHRLERAQRRATCTRAWSRSRRTTPTLVDRGDHAGPLVAAQRRRRALGAAGARRRGRRFASGRPTATSATRCSWRCASTSRRAR